LPLPATRRSHIHPSKDGVKCHELAEDGSLVDRRMQRRQNREPPMLQFEVMLITPEGRTTSVRIGALSAPDAADIAQRMFPGSRVVLTRQV
jgi:hypothetical protein